MSSGELTRRDQLILDHLGRGGISFKEIVRHLFFKGRDPQKVLDRLRSSERIKPLKGFGGNRTAYALADQDLGSQSLPDRLSLVAFCYLGGVPRAPLKKTELKELFDGAVPKGRYFAVERGKDGLFVHHLYIPGDTKQPKDVASHAFGQFIACYENPATRVWLETGHYVYSVLVQSDERAKQIRRALKRLEREHGPSSHLKAKFGVHRIPSGTELEEAFDVLAKEAKD